MYKQTISVDIDTTFGIWNHVSSLSSSGNRRSCIWNYCNVNVIGIMNIINIDCIVNIYIFDLF